MARLFVLLLVCTSVVVSSADEQVCPNNETPKNGIDCKSDCCPGQDCPDPCATACKCNLQYHRLSNGTCIPSRQCPAIPCPENEYFDTCPVCNESCDNAVPSGKKCRPIGRIGITVICQPACRCKEFYWRNKEKQCVTYDECQDQNECDE